MQKCLSSSIMLYLSKYKLSQKAMKNQKTEESPRAVKLQEAVRRKKSQLPRIVLLQQRAFSLVAVVA